MSLWGIYGDPKIIFETTSTISTISTEPGVKDTFVDIVDIVDIPLSLKNAGYPYERLCQYPGTAGKSAACDWWPLEARAEFERKHRMPADMRGMGIDVCGLPEVLRGFSVTGWRLELEASGKIKMIQVARDARNEEGNRDYLRVLRDKIRGCLECLNGAAVIKNTVFKCRACKRE